MKNIYIFEQNNNLYLSEFPTINSSRPSNTVLNKEVTEYLKNIEDPINKIYEKGSDVQIDFGTFVITVDNSLLYSNELKPLMQKIYKYNAVEYVEDGIKKVTRKNRHIGKSIVAVGLSLAIIAFVAKKKSTKEQANDTVSITDESTTDYSITTTYEDESSKTDNKIANITNNEGEPCDVQIDFSEFVADKENSDNVDENYADIIIKYSKCYGIDPEIMIAIAKQERGFHSSTSDGYATGLMQIENNVWIDEYISAFNYEIDDIETVKISERLISTLEGNIKVACMIFCEALSYMKNNVLAAIQCYNMGSGNMSLILREYSYECGRSVYDILNDPTDIGWLNYRYVIYDQGDEFYLERILRYMQDRYEKNNKIGESFQIDSLGKKLNIKCPSKVK